MPEPARYTQGVERITFATSGGRGTVNIRRNRTETGTRAQVWRIIDNYFNGNLQNAERSRLFNRTAVRTWQGLDATGRLRERYGFEPTRLIGRENTTTLRRRNNRREI